MKRLLIFLALAIALFAKGLGTPGSLAMLKPASGGSAPAAPSALVVSSVDAAGVTLGWTDNSTDETGFWVEVYNGPGGAVWANASIGIDCDTIVNPTAANTVTAFSPVTCASAGGTQAELSYCKFRVKATNSFGSSAYSAEVQVPPSVEVVDLDCPEDGNDVTGFFADTGENDTGVELYWSSNSGGSYALLATLAADSGFFRHVDVLLSYSSSVLRYKVRLINSGGNGPYSNIATPHP